jgi:hypothetical protein
MLRKLASQLVPGDPQAFLFILRSPDRLFFAKMPLADFREIPRLPGTAQYVKIDYVVFQYGSDAGQVSNLSI